MRVRNSLKAIFLATIALASASTLVDASVRVSPVLLDVRAPGSAATLTLKNDDTAPVDVQIRIFRWSQKDGKERLERTPDLVVSPPFTTLAPGEEYVVRVVRISRRPVGAEESYRVVVDEVPELAQPKSSSGVTFQLRYSVPVFFTPPRPSEANIAWSARRKGKEVEISAENSGGRRLRLSNLGMVRRDGTKLPVHTGLLGYVLPGAAMRWSFPAAIAHGDDRIRIIADSDQRPVDATVRLGPAR